MRDKLIELMNKAMLTREKDRLLYGEARLSFEEFADDLIAHGVTLTTDINVLTNGDRMRAMPDEELAKVMSVGCCGGESGYCIENEYGEANCIDCWLTWLKQAAKEET